LIFAFRTSTIW